MNNRDRTSYPQGRHGAHSHDGSSSIPRGDTREKRPKHSQVQGSAHPENAQFVAGQQGAPHGGVSSDGVQYQLFRDPQGQLVWLPVQTQQGIPQPSVQMSSQEARLFQSNQVPMQSVHNQQNGQGVIPNQQRQVAQHHQPLSNQRMPQDELPQAHPAQQIPQDRAHQPGGSHARHVMQNAQDAQYAQNVQGQSRERVMHAQSAVQPQGRARNASAQTASLQESHARATNKSDFGMRTQRDPQARQAHQTHQTHQTHQEQYAQPSASAQQRSVAPVQLSKSTKSPVAFSGSGRAEGDGYGHKQQSKAKGSKGWKGLFIVSIAILVAALLAIGLIVGMYFMGRSHNKDYQETAKVSDLDNVALADMTVDWAALQAINPEVVAWIYMPGTTINYPVAQTTNNDKYLYTEFNGSQQHLVTFGTIFVDYKNAKNFTDRNNFIYGHNMNDGSMFAPIAELIDSAAFNEHRTIYLLTPNGNFRLKSFTCVHVAATDPIVQTTFSSNEAYTEYIQDKIDRSEVTPNDTIPAASEIKKSFAFSTCDDTITSEGRIILFAYVAESTSDYAGGLDSASSQSNGASQSTVDSIESAEKATTNEG